MTHRRIVSLLRTVRRDAQDPTGRPVMDQEQLLELGAHLLKMTSAEHVDVAVSHTAVATTRFAGRAAQMSDDGSLVEIFVRTEFGERAAYFETNQLDESVLQRLVHWCETIAQSAMRPRKLIRSAIREAQDTYLPVRLWHEDTVQAMRASRPALLPALIQPVTQAGLRPGGFAGFMAKAEAQLSSDNIRAFYDETDCEITVSARTLDNTSSGWAGRAARSYAQVDLGPLVGQAIDLAKRGINAKAVEPGRWTAILTREAVAQLFRFFAGFYDYFATVALHNTPMWKAEYPMNRIGERIFDARINMQADPTDPDGGFAPFFRQAGGEGYANPVLTLVENGVLKNLAIDAGLAPSLGKPYSEDPWGLRVSGGPSSLEDMISRCKEGIYVNRFSDVQLIDSRTGMMTGLTRDGCFLVKDGKIAMPVKNFRFVDSPMYMLNRLIALGETKRAAYGYTPPTLGDNEYGHTDWPRRPIILPPMMIQDFSFTSLADAV